MQKLLTLNAGSSSIKFAVFDVSGDALVEKPAIKGTLADIGRAATFSAIGARTIDGREPIALEEVVDHDSAWAFLLGWLEEALNGADLIDVGHRIAHGGRDYCAPARLNADIVKRLAALTPLAPGHQPHNLAGVTAISRLCPLDRQVACFDTAFHRTQPRVEQIFAIPRRFQEEGVIRYGFHGLSYAFIAGALADVLKDYPRERVIVAHLGAGASMCALAKGESVATTMGFTALDGLPMATRCGSIDPGVVLHLLEEKKMSAAEIARCLYTESGLLGLSGVSGDMRDLEASAKAEAAEAIDYFVRRAVREIGSLAAVLGGVDALVFTAGVGENSALVREKILKGSAWLGFALDAEANRSGAARITADGKRPSAWVIATNEELMIARHAFRLTAR